MVKKDQLTDWPNCARRDGTLAVVELMDDTPDSNDDSAEAR